METRTDGEATQRLLYAPGLLGPIAELATTDREEARFVYASRVNVPEYMVRGGRTFRLVTDQLGSVRFVVDSTTGEIAQEITYDPFGEVVSDSAPGFQPFGFAGGLYSSETGLTHFGAREYDAGLGRWTSGDPISFGGGDTNLYGYVMHDPVNLRDPDGLLFREVGEFLVGIGDGGTLGGTKWFRENVLDVNVNICSGAYGAGRLTGVAITSYLTAAGATAGAAKVASAPDRFGAAAGAVALRDKVAKKVLDLTTRYHKPIYHGEKAYEYGKKAIDIVKVIIKNLPT